MGIGEKQQSAKVKKLVDERRNAEAEMTIDKVQTDVTEPDGVREKLAELNIACHLNLLLMWNRETTVKHCHCRITHLHARAHTPTHTHFGFCSISGIVALQILGLIGVRNV